MLTLSTAITFPMHQTLSARPIEAGPAAPSLDAPASAPALDVKRGIVPTSLLHLPVELIVNILGETDSPQDVISFAASCTDSYKIVQSNSKWITRRFYANRFPGPLRTLARLVQIARTLPKSYEDNSNEAVEGFVKKYIVKRERPTLMENFKTCIEVFPLKHAVERMRDVMLQKFYRDDHLEHHLIFAGWNVKDFISETCPASYREVIRIETALYWYELYCVLFGHNVDVRRAGRSAQQHVMKSKLSDVELEQIATVYDTLRIACYHAFRDVARHDIVYGLNTTEYDKRHSNNMRHILESGIEFISDLVSAQDFDGRREVLYRHLSEETVPWSCSFWPSTRGPNEPGYLMQGHDFAPFTSLFNVSRPAQFPDTDNGPDLSWDWICRDIPTDSGHTEDLDPEATQAVEALWSPFSRYVLRYRGYIFWDEQRVRNSKMLEKRYSPPRHLESVYHTREQLLMEDVENVKHYHRRMVASWHARKLIFMAGGRGWWDFSDESRVQWGHHGVWKKLSNEHARDRD